MSTDRKALKIMSLIFLVGGIATAGLGALGLVGGSIPGHDGTDLAVYATAMIAMGVIEALTAFFGIGGANNPAKVGTVWVWSIICLVCSVVSLAISAPFLGGTGIGGGDIATIVVDAVFFMFANRVRTEDKERLS